MHRNYTKLLEDRAAIKATKESMLQLGYSREDISKLDIEISRLSTLIRSYKHEDIDETPTKLLSEPDVMFDEVNYVKAPPVIPLTYEKFYHYRKDAIIQSITSQLIDVDVPLGVYAIFKNALINSEEYIMKHHYNKYISGFKK